MAYPPPRRSRYDEDDGYYGAAADDRYTAPPPRRHKSERHHRYRNGGGHRSYKSRAASPEPRPRGREHLGQAYGADHGKHRPRSRSHDRAAKRGGSPPRGRDGGQGPSSSKPSSSRRKSAPAPPVAAGPKIKKQQWWQNPLIQAGARTAFSAGAQAAMQSRKDPSPWLGSKGAKVATAALGAALMDSFGSGGKK
ncbi:hypothetical protein UVI_02015350 [Ustilaginoidea virens]|uniref:Uncharacterized protein n=1 Tax=Ustilaginoidea virens TaxID=1159556 RepID=A0A1B5KT01_USTVR|nr:hypothetical protein UVI_02015350 [Ustilaginoidea virens]